MNKLSLEFLQELVACYLDHGSDASTYKAAVNFRDQKIPKTKKTGSYPARYCKECGEPHSETFFCPKCNADWNDQIGAFTIKRVCRVHDAEIAYRKTTKLSNERIDVLEIISVEDLTERQLIDFRGYGHEPARYAGQRTCEECGETYAVCNFVGMVCTTCNEALHEKELMRDHENEEAAQYD